MRSGVSTSNLWKVEFINPLDPRRRGRDYKRRALNRRRLSIRSTHNHGVVSLFFVTMSGNSSAQRDANNVMTSLGMTSQLPTPKPHGSLPRNHHPLNKHHRRFPRRRLDAPRAARPLKTSPPMERPGPPLLPGLHVCPLNNPPQDKSPPAKQLQDNPPPAKHLQQD